MINGGPLDLTLWRDRLISQVSSLRQVGLAADLIRAQAGTLTSPAAFVVSVSDDPRAAGSSGDSTINQTIDAVVGIVIAVTNHKGSRAGSSASEDAQPIRAAVMNALVGWMPVGTHFSIRYGGGRQLGFQDATVWHLDRYRTAYFLRQEF